MLFIVCFVCAILHSSHTPDQPPVSPNKSHRRVGQRTPPRDPSMAAHAMANDGCMLTLHTCLVDTAEFNAQRAAAAPETHTLKYLMFEYYYYNVDGSHNAKKTGTKQHQSRTEYRVSCMHTACTYEMRNANTNIHKHKHT